MVGNAPVQPSPTRQPGRGVYVAGVILVVIGGLMLMSELLNRYAPQWWQWPYSVVLIGAGMIVAGLLLHSKARPGFLVPGFIVLNVGLVLLYQNWSGNWESWSYVWPIVAPGGVALAILVGGLLDRDGEAIRRGLVLLAVSAGLFLVFTFFFVGFVFGGFDWAPFLTTPWLGGALVMVVGAALLVWGLMRRD